jgi:hypothetical protein
MLAFIHINKSAGRTFTHTLRSSYGLRHCQVESLAHPMDVLTVSAQDSAATEETLLHGSRAWGIGFGVARFAIRRAGAVRRGRPPAHQPPHALQGAFLCRWSTALEARFYADTLPRI